MSIKMFRNLQWVKNFHVEHELDNAVYKFAWRWLNSKKKSAIYLLSTREFRGILSHMAEQYAWKWLAVNITENSCENGDSLKVGV